MREVKPTQKPVPSSDIKDLFFNSGLLDIWATSLERKYIDRFGNCHLTAAGMEWIFNELITKFKIDSEQALLAAGYAPAGTFQDGAEVVSRNGTVLWKLPDGDGDHYRWDGDLPKQVPTGSTPQSTGGIGSGAWVSVGDASLRGDIKNGDGELIGVRQPYPHATYQTQHDKNSQSLTVLDWGAKEGIDSSFAAQNMINDTGMLISPAGFTLMCKNIDIGNTSHVNIQGKAMLPDGCVDFDRIFFANNSDNLNIYINELDGNRIGQSGQIGTHLLYLTNCNNTSAYIRRAGDNYFPRTFVNIPSPDGKRTESAGCLFFHECHNSTFIADYIYHWGREGMMMHHCINTTAGLGMAQGRKDAMGDEYSGFQFSGENNKLLYATVDHSAASGGSFDCKRSIAGRIVISNNRYFGSLGMGHPNSPAVDCIIESVVSINSAGNGIQFAAGSSGNRILSATVINASMSGINQSDNAKDNYVSNFVIKDSGQAQVTSFTNTLTLVNGDLTNNANNVIQLNATGGGGFVTRNVRLSKDNALNMRGFNGLSGNSEATLVDGNINIYSHIVLYPANASAALSNAYVKSIRNGECTISTANGLAAPSGTSFRYMVI